MPTLDNLCIDDGYKKGGLTYVRLRTVCAVQEIKNTYQI
jgi:hypothetical protein